MTLSETEELMNSKDYKDRFLGEYMQLRIRRESLGNMLKKWDAGKLDFHPTCPRSIYTLQTRAMDDYLAVLKTRADMEGIELP